MHFQDVAYTHKPVDKPGHRCWPAGLTNRSRRYIYAQRWGGVLIDNVIYFPHGFHHAYYDHNIHRWVRGVKPREVPEHSDRIIKTSRLMQRFSNAALAATVELAGYAVDYFTSFSAQTIKSTLETIGDASFQFVEDTLEATV